MIEDVEPRQLRGKNVTSKCGPIIPFLGKTKDQSEGHHVSKRELAAQENGMKCNTRATAVATVAPLNPSLHPHVKKICRFLFFLSTVTSVL